MNMRELCINAEWTFKDVVDNLKALKLEYEEVLASFYYFDLRMIVEFKRNTRNKFYALKLQEWEKDKIWNYMNGFEYLSVLKGIVERRKK